MDLSPSSQCTQGLAQPVSLSLSQQTPSFKICEEGIEMGNKTVRTGLYPAYWLQRQMILCGLATARGAVLSLQSLLQAILHEMYDCQGCWKK